MRNSRGPRYLIHKLARFLVWLPIDGRPQTGNHLPEGDAVRRDGVRLRGWQEGRQQQQERAGKCQAEPHLGGSWAERGETTQNTKFWNRRTFDMAAGITRF